MEYKVTNPNKEVYDADYMKLNDIKRAPRVWGLETGIT